MAKREIQNYSRYNYILINHVLEESSENLRAIVQSERLQRAGRPLSNEESAVMALADCCRLAKVRGRLKAILDSFRSPNDPEGSNPP